MTTNVLTHYDIDVEDIEYLRHGDKPLLARVYKPRGTGPFPLIIDIHGGAWCKKDRTSDAGTDEPLARSGVVVVALDFRMGLEGRYPASIADINYAIRWSKARAAEFGGRPDRVGILGVSSGGHQAMLAAMRPDDPRYTVLPLPRSPVRLSGDRRLLLFRHVGTVRHPESSALHRPAHEPRWRSRDRWDLPAIRPRAYSQCHRKAVGPVQQGVATP